MGSSNSTSNTHITVTETTDLMAVKALAESGKLRLGDIIEFANGASSVFGIVTSLTGTGGTVATVINGNVKEVPMNSIDAKAGKNNFYDSISTAYDAGDIVKKAKENIGKDADDSKSFVQLCRNGIKY